MLYNINPVVWGASFWDTFHIITFAYPEAPSNEDKQNIVNFFHAAKHMLPCENCRYHFEHNLKTYPLTDEILSSKYKLISWLVTIHNEVNIRLGKSIVPVEQVIQKYTGNTSNSNSMDMMNPLLFILLIMLLIIYVRNN
jgi:hypothetical protein